MISIFTVSFLSTFLVSLLLIKTQGLHRMFSHDTELIGAQKFHSNPVPRIGSLSLVAGLITGGYYFALRSGDTMHFMYWAGVAAIPVLLGGLFEDLTKSVSARNRLFLAFLSASIAFYELDPGLKSIGWTWFDKTILAVPGISLVLTLLI